jgi:serine/threonine protein kinase
MKSPRGETPSKIPADIAVTSQVPMPTALWHMDFEELHFSEKIGMGAAATVYRGTYRDQTVAIKILRTGESLTEEKDLDDFRKELEILKTLRAPNIVTFMGATLEPRLCMVLEYCSRGSLHSFLKDTSRDLTWDLFFKWGHAVHQRRAKCCISSSHRSYIAI